MKNSVRPAGSRLFWRIYLHGIGLLVLTSVAVVAVGQVIRPIDSHPRHRRSITLLAERLDHLVAEMPRDPSRVKVLLDSLPVDATVYDVNDALIASNCEPPLPWSAERHAALDKTAGFQLPKKPDAIGAMTLSRSYAVLVWKPPWSHDEDRWRRILTIILVMLAILTIVSLPLARRIANPIDSLIAAAQRLGSGDFRSRTGITRRDDIGDLARAFDEMADRIEKLLRNEKELLANVSHELRTPLARMRVALELAAEGDSAAAKRYMGEVATDITELERLVEDVLTTARFELADGRDSGLPPLRIEDVASDEVVREAATRFSTAHPQRKLDLDIGHDAPRLAADRVLLRRAIDNLLDNAAKYSEADTPVRMTLARINDAAVVVVEDRGAGIPKEDMDHLFTPFFRGDRSRSRVTGGFGLGLALARRIVEAHDGKLEATSTVGEGSSFTVRIPSA
ncbi:MAG: sensor histidine kinase [Myxococcota bacterium]|nr:HAMP domain-containing sensor histidine kinase [Myxococcota bacterium]